MPKPVVLTGVCQCSFGLAPSPIVILPTDRVLTPFLPIGSVMDHIPLLNILPFGMCKSLANPVVMSATISARIAGIPLEAWGGVMPMPCVPITPTPWTTTKPMFQIRGKPMLLDNSTTTCVWGGVIKIAHAGATVITV